MGGVKCSLRILSPVSSDSALCCTVVTHTHWCVVYDVWCVGVGVGVGEGRGRSVVHVCCAVAYGVCSLSMMT